jgi:hypothetical protein
VYTLLLAYPHLSPSTQQQVKIYLENNYGPEKKYDLPVLSMLAGGTVRRENIQSSLKRSKILGEHLIPLLMIHQPNQFAVGVGTGNRSRPLISMLRGSMRR